MSRALRIRIIRPIMLDMLDRLRAYFSRSSHDLAWVLESSFLSFTIRRGVFAFGGIGGILFTLPLWWWKVIDITTYSLVMIGLIWLVGGGVWGATAWIYAKFKAQHRNS